MKRKALAIMLGTAMVASVVTGCSSKPKETEKVTEAQTEAKTEAVVETEAVTEAPVETEAVTEAPVETEVATEAPTEAVTEAAEAEETEAVTEAAEAEETEAVTEAAEAEETEAVTEAAEAEETEAVTEAAEAEETEAVTEAAEAEETEAVTEAAEAEETEAVTEAAEAEETEAVTEAAEAEETEAVTEAAEAEETEAVTEAAEETVAEAVTEAEAAAEGLEAGKEYKVGIVQFMDHASLNQIESAIEEQLSAVAQETGAVLNFEDYTFNGEGDGTTLNQIASQLISDEVDVIVAIATPAAQVVQAVDEDAEIPLVFSAVTDPAGAGLVESNEVPGGYITGTSDALNTETMMKLILAQNPETKKVGLLYSNSEDASKVPVQEAKAFLEAEGVEVVEKTGTTSSEISQAVDALIADGVDAIFTPTDNTVMSAELSVYEKLQEAGVPHYCGADSFALNGAFLGFGVNYTDLGTATADMVVTILEQGAVNDLPVATFDNGIATINTETAEALGYDLDAVKEAFAPYCSDIVEVVTAENFE